ncbi:hypothetical protein [Bradyrhizobium sp. 131]|uniref:hypothetical protein n=1 Tax=Bradyrhizobium sp. 131 TaxID=2782609 RepID=UPI001FFE8BD9|nr:hypothetical protein [Bradyrhizobium sp. 131]
MTALVSYSTGTVSVASGGTTVTGVGAIWSGTNVKPGDLLQIGNFQTVISDVTDTTHLVIPPWGGGAQSGVAYKIWQVSPQRFAGASAMATVNQLVAAFETSGFFVFVDIADTVPDPSLGDDGQYAFQPTTGKTWAKVGGVWTYLGIYKGFNFTGAYNGATTYSYGDVMTDAGSSYVWINATRGSGHTAPNATYWQLLASIGVTGATGPTGAGYGGTSTTSLAIGTGSKAFTTQAGLAYTNGARVRASSAANTSNWMEGLVTYSGTTLTMTADKTGGSGTKADWNLNVVGQPGAGDLTAANNLSDVASVATARGNLGLTESIVTAVVGQLPGTSGTTQPGAGKIGERISATGTPSLTSASAANVAGITPTAGVWDLEMVNVFGGPGGTTSSDWVSAMSTVNASTASGVVGEAYHTRMPSGADMSIVHTSRRVRITTSGSTTYYLNAQATYSGASYGCSGTIQATRAA